MSKLFYYHGKTFDNEQEFFKFVQDWPNLPVDLEDIKNMLDVQFKTIEINNELREGKLTNRLAYQILRMQTDWVEDGS